MRVLFIYLLDTFALPHEPDTKGIIPGVCLDARIGEGYTNHPLGTEATAYLRILSCLWQPMIVCRKH